MTPMRARRRRPWQDSNTRYGCYPRFRFDPRLTLAP
jgi:hypothetical protein